MRFRFSIRTTLVLIAALSGILAGGLFAYREYVVPRTPLIWKEFDIKRMETIADTSHPVLISQQDLTLTMQPDFQYYLEFNVDNSPKIEFRKFVHRHKIELLSFTLNNQGRGEESSNAISNLLLKQYPDIERNILLTPPFDPETEDIRLMPQFVLALPGKKRLIYFPDGLPDEDDIMAAVLSNGEIVRGTEYFTDRHE